MVKIAVLKMGNIGVSPLFEFLFDERAERVNVKFRVFGSGSKMTGESLDESIRDLVNWPHDLTILITPNASLPHCMSVIEALRETGTPLIVLSDSPSLKVVEDLRSRNVGYIIITADPMIGARREFLDPTEMVIFNSDILKLLAGTGVMRFIVKIIDNVIEKLENGVAELPFIVIDSSFLLENPPFNNSYANAKALAAFKMAELVGKMNQEACFKIQEWARYTTLAAAAHEVLSAAAKLVDELRDMLKTSDTLLREPHDVNGRLLRKIKLLEKPE
ncbi:MAG: F420-dependent methylenetetrahydromethanopterin dehydrogenase [Candidatus Odinarchaeum yellowstonii]|jgi:methylenetetrahydromethanopterin dehydrogenase|uniref:F420-dependent methylenetetrahydromethanopterin dehydrogenase n=1 Tax=Odinarchaeota yellowstonii (strain LCB_4) TaxID=1841599 RepID=A0AAF0D114_ODILC|nr:MAG: F420-dependent methylenetetrahydromethanopterin dehydrogenase [Candidatus Odinarchaeum yellowstonii]